MSKDRYRMIFGKNTSSTTGFLPKILRLLIPAALLLLLMQGIVFAQTDASIEFYGTIQSTNSTGVVINGQIIDISGAVVNTVLTVGTGVRVQAVVLPDGSLTARQIDGLPVGVIPGIVEINGTITDFVMPILTVGGETVDISGAEISGSIVIGQSVRVFALAIGSGVWQARFIDAVNNAPVTTPEVLQPVTTPEVQPPVTTPEVGDNSNNNDNDDDDNDNDNNRGRGSDDDDDDGGRDNSGRGSDDDDDN